TFAETKQELELVARSHGWSLDGVRPFHVAAAPGAVQDISQNDVNGYAIRIRVVDGHGCMLQSDRAVRHDHHELAFDLRVAVSHRDRRLLMQAGDPPRSLVASVVQERLMKRAK